MDAKRLREERNTVSLSSCSSLGSFEFSVPSLANAFWWAKAPHISQLHQRVTQHCWAAWCVHGRVPVSWDAAARRDGDEAQPAGDHGSAPNAT